MSPEARLWDCVPSQPPLPLKGAATLTLKKHSQGGTPDIVTLPFTWMSLKSKGPISTLVAKPG